MVVVVVVIVVVIVVIDEASYKHSNLYKCLPMLLTVLFRRPSR